MNLIKKQIYIGLLSVVMLVIALYGAMKSDLVLPSFLLYNPNTETAERIYIFDSEAGDYYVFLPSYADLSQLTVSNLAQRNISIDSKVLCDGMNLGGFAFENPYEFLINGERIGTIVFYKSENVGTLYINTATGTMERIHEDKDYEEQVSVTLYTAEGNRDYSNNKSILKGRGNATFAYDKRPYLLKLPYDGNLLDMGSATNWVLLANAYDETNLNNKLVLDLASRVGLPGTPDCRWVDVYLNGEYNGLYLLTEKVEVHENRLDVVPNSTDFLCKVDLNSRWDTLSNPFISETGRTIEISYPKTVTAPETDRVIRLVNQMEKEILSGKDLRDSPIIDLDSWVRRYLIDEIFGNIDSDLASSYFYNTNGLFFAGPVWDYDMILGDSLRNQNPYSFIAKNYYKSAIFHSPYYSALYSNESFYIRLQEIYQKEYRPLIRALVTKELDELSDHISIAAKMNSLRWKTMFVDLQKKEMETVHTPTALKDYLSSRMEFLDNVWIANEVYCTVQFEPTANTPFWNISVRQGSYLETDYMDIVSTTWIDTSTGEAFDFSQPIMTDMILTKKPAEVSSSSDPLVTRDYITILSIALLITVLMGFVIVDTIHRYKERSRTDAHPETKVSS